MSFGFYANFFGKHVSFGKSSNPKMADTAKVEEVDRGEDLQRYIEKAKAGDVESQLAAGRYLLKQADSTDGEKRQEYGEQAIQWLVEASKQGNDEATEQLQQCLDTETGISEKNLDDVSWCVNTSSMEKKLRLAARNMFNKINTAHKEILSPDEYSEAIKKMTGGKEQKILLAAGKKIGQNISETEFVKILSRKVQGTLSFTSNERSAAFESASAFQKMVKFPKETAIVVGDQILEVASRDGLGIVMGWIPVDQIYFLTLFFVYGFLTPKFLLEIVPLVLFYISYIVIIITTLQMFYKRKKLKEASALAEMLKEYEVGVDVSQTQSQYSWNSLTPYLVYFAFIPIVVASFSLADKTYVPCSELCVLNAVLCGICFVAISDSHDLVTLLALFCNFLAAMPVFMQGFPIIPVFTPIVNFLSGSLVTLDLVSGFKLNIGIPSICYLIIPIFFVQMAARQSFQGMYKVAVPHLVCYFWFNLITTMYPFTTWFGLARATVGYVLIPILLPISVFLFFIGLIYAFVKLMLSDMFGKLVVTILLGCIPILLTQTKKLFGGKLDKHRGFKVLKKVLMVAFAIFAVIPLIFVRLPSSEEAHLAKLSTEEFHRVCDADIENAMKCQMLKGTKVTWTGVIKSKTVTGVSNDIKKMLDVFPSFVSQSLVCIYGRKYDCSDVDLTENERSYCNLRVMLGHECGVENSDKFTYGIGLALSNGGSANLEAGSGFHQTFLAIQEGDEVEVKAIISEAMARPVKIQLKKLKVLNRQLELAEVEEEDDDVYYNLIEQSISVAFNFFWYPLVEYVPHVYIQGEDISVLD